MSEVGTKPQLGLLFLMQNANTDILLELVLANTRGQIAQGRKKLLWQWHSAVGYLRCGQGGSLAKGTARAAGGCHLFGLSQSAFELDHSKKGCPSALTCPAQMPRCL